jgi:hypothetical protein
MRLYIDLSCVNRVIDDQSQERIRLETEAVRRGDWGRAKRIDL